jgi:hypothetical protein
MKRSYSTLAGALALLMLAMALKGELLRLPQPDGTVAPGAFDTSRALGRLRRILGPERPHPVDSAEGDAVRARLLAEMRAVGLTPAVSDDFACNSSPRQRAVSCARVHNLVATIGPASGRRVLAVAHYDSTGLGPGAADDGIGVASLLETAALLRGVPLDRPATFLITDGEEAGLLGARAFLERSPLAGSVEAVANFEARGVTGPAIMFETSRPNAAAISRFDVARPVANSLATDFYRLIPNSTDVAVFEERGWTTLNFAVIGNETRYHSPGDTLAALDPASLAHMGSQAFATVRALATGPAPSAGGERHYFDLAGRVLIVVPALLSFVLLAILLLFFSWAGWRRRQGLGLAVAGIVAGLVDAAVLAWLGAFLVGLGRSGAWWRAHPEAVSFAVALSALAACAATMVIVRRTPVASLRTAFWIVLLVLAVAVTVLAPGAAVLFVFPPLVAALGMGTRFEQPAALAAAVLLFLLMAPLLHLVETLLGLGSAWMFAPLAAAILWPWLIELKPLFAATRLRPVLGAMALVYAAGWAWVATVPAYSDDRQERFGIEYAWDADAQRGRWAIVNDDAPLPPGMAGNWQARTEVPWSATRRWTAPAAALPFEAPALEPLDERAVPGGRLVTVRLRGTGFDSLALRAPPEVDVRRVASGGFDRPVGRGAEDDPFFLRCVGRSCDGAVFTLLIGTGAPAQWTLIGVRNGLPDAARPLLARRPAFARPQYSPDATIVTRRLRV